MIDYAVLRVIWWGLMGFLLAGFAVMDGFDLGVAALLPWVARTDKTRRVVINTIGPVWESNQVWFILGGGVFFAAWPYLYAVSFSGFYLAMFLVLVTFIMRPVGFKYRSKVADPRWRRVWDWTLCLSGLIAALTFGVAVGNVLQGVPFQFDPNTLRATYTGTFLELFNPFALLCGLLSVFMLLMHGALYLSVKTEDPIKSRAMDAAQVLGLLVIVVFALAGYWVAMHLSGYALAHPMSHTAPSNPLNKTVVREVGAWVTNYHRYPLSILAPLFGGIGALLAVLTARLGNGRFAFCCSGLSVFGIVTTVGVSMFPFILPSSDNPTFSLMVWDSSASQLSLFIMLISAIIFLPIILLYVSWVYRVMRGKVTTQMIDEDQHTAY